MSPHDHDDQDRDLAQEMLELYFDCHPRPKRCAAASPRTQRPKRSTSGLLSRPKD